MRQLIENSLDRRVAFMHRHFYWLHLPVFVLINLNHAFLAFGYPPPIVTLETGMLEGIHFSSMENEVAFLGVPYAASPVGELRWKPPQPVNRWTGTRKATQFGLVCPATACALASVSRRQ